MDTVSPELTSDVPQMSEAQAIAATEDAPDLEKPSEGQITEGTAVEVKIVEAGPPAPNVQQQAALNTFMEELERDISEFKKFCNLFTACSDFAQDLDHAVQEMHKAAVRIVEEHIPDPALNLHDQIVEVVGNSKAGVDLVLKMMSRLGERTPKINTDKVPAESRMEKLENSPIPAEASEQKAFFEQIANHNYKLLTDMRRAAEDSRDAIFSFIKTHVLAIVDGVVDGRRHFEQQKANLVESYPADSEAVQKWFEVYDSLFKLLNNLLFDFQVEAIAPIVGDVVQYDVHEPFDTVKDDEFPNETVHELVRPGYRYVGFLYGEVNHVVRPALIVVTKNG